MVMKYLWNLGYIPRRNVLLVEQTEKASQYTDIDVLGIKVDEELNSSFIVCDCKSGASAKTGERMFWISGVMKYFGATRGLFIRPQSLSQKYFDLAKSLNIIPLSQNELLQLHRNYDIDSLDQLGSFSDNSPIADEIFSLLKKFEPKVTHYILSSYWEDFPRNQIATTISSCKRMLEIPELEGRAKSFLAAYILSLMSLAVLRFSSEVITMPNNMKILGIELGLYGGRLVSDERKNLLKRFHAFMSEEIRTRYKVNYPLSENDFLENLTPDYMKHLVDLVVRVCATPRTAILVPRFFDLLAFDVILGGKKFDINKMLLFNQRTDSKNLFKPVIDTFTFADRSGLISKEFRKIFEDIVSNLNQ
jgi:hypothetical protein